MRNFRNLGGVAIAVAGTALLAGCTAEQPEASADTAAPTASESAPRSEQPLADPDASAAYVDGSYQATGTYGSGPSFIGVELALTDGIVTAVEIETPATNETSLEYQRLFAGGIGALVVGRPIAELDVDNVAGSSSTVDGYNDAVTHIMQEAARP